MSRLFAHVKFKNSSTIDHILQLFFEDFEPGNFISYENKCVKLAIFFNEPPRNLIKTLHTGTIIALECDSEGQDEEENFSQITLDELPNQNDC